MLVVHCHILLPSLMPVSSLGWSRALDPLLLASFHHLRRAKPLLIAAKIMVWEQGSHPRARERSIWDERRSSHPNVTVILKQLWEGERRLPALPQSIVWPAEGISQHFYSSHSPRAVITALH